VPGLRRDFSAHRILDITRLQAHRSHISSLPVPAPRRLFLQLPRSLLEPLLIIANFTARPNDGPLMKATLLIVNLLLLFAEIAVIMAAVKWGWSLF
jgi:hypothetical protein